MGNVIKLGLDTSFDDIKLERNKGEIRGSS
jgi:hypothetical protein